MSKQEPALPFGTVSVSQEIAMNDEIKRELIGALLQTAAENGETLERNEDLKDAIKNLRKLADTLEQDTDKVIGFVMAIATHRDERNGANVETNSLGTAAAILATDLALQRNIEQDFGTLKALMFNLNEEVKPKAPLVVLQSDNTVH